MARDAGGAETKRLAASVVFIEQPIKRQNALPFIEAPSAKVLATAEEQFDERARASARSRRKR